MKEQEIKKLYHGMTAIDERYIEEARQDRFIRKKHRSPMLMVACLASTLVLCGAAYAVSTYWGVGSADGIQFEELTKPFGTLNGDVEIVDEAKITASGKSELITDYSNVIADHFVCYPIDDSEIPVLYFSPGYMVIFTQEVGGGWTLNTGEEVTFSFDLNEKQSVELELGYVFNGCYYELSTTKGNKFSEIFQASEQGEYYFCVTNKSSTNAVIESGSIETD